MIWDVCVDFCRKCQWIDYSPTWWVRTTTLREKRTCIIATDVLPDLFQHPLLTLGDQSTLVLIYFHLTSLCFGFPINRMNTIPLTSSLRWTTWMHKVLGAHGTKGQNCIAIKLAKKKNLQPLQFVKIEPVLYFCIWIPLTLSLNEGKVF